MTPAAITSLLVPYIECDALPESLAAQISAYLDLLVRWNTRINLTAIREPDEIVRRHFGESLFAARRIFPAGKPDGAIATGLADVGSGAGFPGLPIHLWVPEVSVTLIEAQVKKATFLREVVRALGLSGVDVLAMRAERIAETFDVVTLRAVERFDSALGAAVNLVRPGGRIVLLIGEDQVDAAGVVLPGLKWQEPSRIPGSLRRVVLVGWVG